jgi:hypothetical protein
MEINLRQGRVKDLEELQQLFVETIASVCAQD